MRKLYYFMLMGALLLGGCVNDTFDEIAATEGEITFVVGDFKQFESADGRAVGTPDAGKTAWEVGDELLVTTDEGGYTTLTLDESGVWAATQSLSLTTDSNIAVAYAPHCELVDGVITPKSDLPLGTGEYFYGSATYAEGTVTISFAESVRTYSRLRLAAAADKELSVAVTKFTPAGATEEIDTSYTLTTDEKGNAYLYGIIAAGGTLAVDNSGTTTERTLANGTVAGKSYALYSNSYCYLPDGETFNTTLKNILGSCTAIKFVAGSSVASPIEYITNGSTLEIHTACDKFVATDCHAMFYYLPAITSIDFNGCFDTSQVTDMRSMFNGCKSLSVLDVSGFDTSKVTAMGFMFNGCEALTSLDVSSFDTSKVTDMNNMFSSCKNLTSLDLSNFDTSKVTDMEYMFDYCLNLTSLDLSGFDTSQVTNMRYMFYYCNKLAMLDVSSFNTSQVTTMFRMFYNCGSLTSLDVSGFDTSKVTNMDSMFYNCGELTSLDLSNFDTSQVTDMNNMFYKCSALTSLDISGFNTSQVTKMHRMFFDCMALTSLDVSGFNTSQVTDMNGMFDNCSALTSLDLSGFDTSQVTDMNNMFNKCSALTSLDMSGFNTSKVTNMGSMFNDCNALTLLDVSNFDTSKVTAMGFMFYGCESLSTLDLLNFDTSKVTKMNYMFSNCESMTALDLTSFTFSQSPNVERMFPYIGVLLEQQVVPVYVTQEGKAYLDGQNFTDTKAKFMVPYAETTLDGAAAYEVTNAGGLLAWAEAAKENPNLGLVLGADIDLTGRAWTPVGTPEAPYTGSVEGNNHKITGLDIDVTVGGDTAPTGLFGTLYYADIRNFSVYGDIEVKANDKSYVGGVAGNAQCSKITNVHSYVNIHAAQGVTGAKHVGGIAGGAGLDISYEDRVIISRCSFNGSINMPDAYETVGGILGYTTSRVEINNCANYGEITATNAQYVGGILGYANVWTLYGPYNCLNVGRVTGAEKASAIVGWLRCYSVSTIHTNYFLAGTASEAFGGPLRDEEVENNVAPGPAEAESVDASALASGSVTSLLNNGEGSIWIQGTDYPEIDRTVE